MLRIVNIWCASLRKTLTASELSKLGKQQERLLSSLLLDQNLFLRESGFLAARPVCPCRAVQSVWPFFQKCAYRQIKQGSPRIFAGLGTLISLSMVVSSAGVASWGCSPLTLVWEAGVTEPLTKGLKYTLAQLGLWKALGNLFPSCNFAPSFLLCVLNTNVCCSKYYLLFFSQGNL